LQPGDTEGWPHSAGDEFDGEQLTVALRRR
jgi:hypothetical protein